MSTRAVVPFGADVVRLSRFMYSIVSEVMVSGSCGFCRCGGVSADSSSARGLEGRCGMSSQWNLAVSVVADPKVARIWMQLPFPVIVTELPDLKGGEYKDGDEEYSRQ